MTDLEKVIKGWECHMEADTLKCADCPYREGWRTCNYADTLYKDVYDLLKEQEAKKVLQIRNVAYRTIGYCPSCGRGLDSYEDGNSGDHITNYCYNCGQAVKWE